MHFGSARRRRNPVLNAVFCSNSETARSWFDRDPSRHESRQIKRGAKSPSLGDDKSESASLVVSQIQAVSDRHSPKQHLRRRVSLLTLKFLTKKHLQPLRFFEECVSESFRHFAYKKLEYLPD